MRIVYSLLLIIVLVMYGLALSMVKKRFTLLTPILGWMVGLGYFVLAPLTILTLNGGFTFPNEYELSGAWWKLDLSKSQFLAPYIVIWLSLMLTCATVYCFCYLPGKKQDREHIISRPSLERIILITMACSVVDWIATIWFFGGFEEFLVSHWYTRAMPLIERFGSVYILYMRASLVNQILFTSAAGLYTSEGLRHGKTRWGFTSLIVVFLAIEMFMSGNRIFFALYLLTFLSSGWAYGRKKVLVATVALAPILVLVFSVWISLRHDVSKMADSVDTLEVDASMRSQAVNSLMNVTEGGAVMLAINIINDYGNKYVYLHGSTYARLFTFFEPRILNPGRTPDFQTITAARYEPGEETTLGSTALGEAYANFGPAGILVLPLFTWFALWYSNWLTTAYERHALLTAVSFVMFIWFARATFAENSMSLIGAGILIWMLKLEKGLCARSAVEEKKVSSVLTSVFHLAPPDPLS